ncbi:hypothetical protein [Marilutibacter maris]|uniref:hypothetical protein n=1 Tax=Marilutibacter maris TaxID=1605891 RepID=UPI000DAA809A|nr:hypothetical protein [Lysobacter maris]
MRAYRLSRRGIEELGPVSSEQVQALIADAEASLSGAGDEGFGIGLYRSEQDFIEIAPVGNDTFLLHSDRICDRRGLLARLFGGCHIQTRLVGRRQAIDAAQYYLEVSRESFERRYGD